VGTLVYQSTVEPSSYYLAFDDLPTTQTSWMGAPTGLSNDGDFNDYVVFIKGACADQGAGGGAPGNGGSAGGVGGSNGGAGSAGARGGSTEGGRGGTDSTGGAGGGAIVNGTGGALASGGATGHGGTSGGGGASASAGTTGSAGVSGGVPAASSAKSGCSCATVPDQGAEGPLAAGLVLALALCHRRRRQT
jgi:MYXO-CTERM domain-containing protein